VLKYPSTVLDICISTGAHFAHLNHGLNLKEDLFFMPNNVASRFKFETTLWIFSHAKVAPSIYDVVPDVECKYQIHLLKIEMLAG